MQYVEVLHPQIATLSWSPVRAIFGLVGHVLRVAELENPLVLRRIDFYTFNAVRLGLLKK